MAVSTAYVGMDDETLSNSAQGFRAPFHRTCVTSSRCAQFHTSVVPVVAGRMSSPSSPWPTSAFLNSISPHLRHACRRNSLDVLRVVSKLIGGKSGEVSDVSIPKDNGHVTFRDGAPFKDGWLGRCGMNGRIDSRRRNTSHHACVLPSHQARFVSSVSPLNRHAIHLDNYYWAEDLTSVDSAGPTTTQSRHQTATRIDPLNAA